MLLSTSKATSGYKCKCNVILAVVKGKAVSKNMFNSYMVKIIIYTAWRYSLEIAPSSKAFSFVLAVNICRKNKEGKLC